MIVNLTLCGLQDVRVLTGGGALMVPLGALAISIQDSINKQMIIVQFFCIQVYRWQCNVLLQFIIKQSFWSKSCPGKKVVLV